MSATIIEGAQGGHALLLAAALILFTVCCATVALAASPYRAPFTARSHFAVQAAALAAFGFAAWNDWGRIDDHPGAGWVALGLGIVMVAVGSYRPAAELTAAGTIATAFIGFVTFVDVARTRPDAPPLAIAIGSSFVVLGFSYAIAAYSGASIRSLERSTRRAAVAFDALSVELRDGIARSVHEDRATILDRDVTPFFRELLARRSIGEADRDRASAIAGSIREVMVADVDRTWIESLMGPFGRGGRVHGAAHDPSRLASGMNGGQRTALRAFLVAGFDDPSVTEVSVTISPDGRAAAGVIRLRLGRGDRLDALVRGIYPPLFAAMRVAFSSASWEMDDAFLIVRFGYGPD